MERYPFDRKLFNEADILNYYSDAIHYRNEHKEQSASIAMHVFDKTHPKNALTFPISSAVDRLRDEFGALEAIGTPEDDALSMEDHENEVWLRLLDLIQKEKG